MQISFGKFKDRHCNSLIGDTEGERWARWVVEQEDFTNKELRSYIIENVLPFTKMPCGKHKDKLLQDIKLNEKEYYDYMINKQIFKFLSYL